MGRGFRSFTAWPGQRYPSHWDAHSGRSRLHTKRVFANTRGPPRRSGMGARSGAADAFTSAAAGALDAAGAAGSGFVSTGGAGSAWAVHPASVAAARRRRGVTAPIVAFRSRIPQDG